MNYPIPDFTTDYGAILQRTENINALQYGKTRNFLTGAITYLSPYLSRGVISLRYVKEKILLKNDVSSAYKLLQELAWREYFQRVWEARPELLEQDAKYAATQTFSDIPVNITECKTGIEAVDNGINRLYETGYMHNHLRMYTAMLTCNIAKTKWQQPAAWLYYHLLDGDLASNNLNWQWIAGTFSTKKYIANQENINRYCFTNQANTFLDVGYEQLSQIAIPDAFTTRQKINYVTVLPQPENVALDSKKPLFIHNAYHLDPEWRQGEDANRVLLLEPEQYEKYPVSGKVINFILGLAKNIKGIQVFVGSFDTLYEQYNNTPEIHYKKHPLTAHYKGTAVENDWMFPEVSGYFPSFSAYWKKCQRHLF